MEGMGVDWQGFTAKVACKWNFGKGAEMRQEAYCLCGHSRPQSRLNFEV